MKVQYQSIRSAKSNEDNIVGGGNGSAIVLDQNSLYEIDDIYFYGDEVDWKPIRRDWRPM